MDIKKKKRLEAQLLQAQKMEAIGSLAGGVAHDLNNILSGLVSYPELLLLDIPQDSPLREPILTIQRSGEKAANIVQDLLTLARRGVPVIEVVNLNQIISDYLKSPEYENLKFYHPGIKLVTDFETELLNIMGSPVHLSKTVMNLISNAAEAMLEGGNIVITTENRHMDKVKNGFDEIDKGDYATLIIKDTGIGIPAEEVPKIFDRFYRVDKSRSRELRGSGLGLAICKWIADLHDAVITVDSELNEGSTFTLIFPIS